MQVFSRDFNVQKAEIEMSIHTVCAIITSSIKLQDEAEEVEEQLFAGWAKNLLEL